MKAFRFEFIVAEEDTGNGRSARVSYLSFDGAVKLISF